MFLKAYGWFRIAFGLLIAGLLLAGSGCARKPAKQELSQGTLIPAGDLREEHGWYGVVFYYPPDPKASTDATARQLVTEQLPGFTFSADPKSEIQSSLVAFAEELAPLRDYPLPDADYFRHAGRGLDEQTISTIQKSSRATQLILVAPREKLWSATRTFSRLAHEFALRTGAAALWDSSTRECFSPEAWQQKRLESWTDGEEVPDVASQITIHLYRPSEESRYLRAITLGMEKFGLPDLVIERLISSNARGGGNLINFAVQSLVENPEISNPGQHPFRLDQIRHSRLSKELRNNVLEGATEQVTLALLAGTAQEGDPGNRLIELDFRNSPGNTEDEKRESALAAVWGSTDSIVEVTHDAGIEAASGRARAKLPELHKAFAEGLPPGSRLLLKAPFARDDAKGSEWMWTEVMNWPAKGKLEGILQNQPFHVADLQPGSRVEIDPEQIFDYILVKPDGTMEGNETGKLMQASSGERE